MDDLFLYDDYRFRRSGADGQFLSFGNEQAAELPDLDSSLVGQVVGLLTLVFAGPTVILRNALRAQVFENRPPAWLLISFFIAMIWSCLSGVFILSLMLSA